MTLSVIGVGMGRSMGRQVQIAKIIAKDFIRIADNWENKATRAMHEH